MYVKDIQFNRLRAFNLTDMLSLVMDRSDWYVNKTVDAANNRIEMWLKNCHSKYIMKVPNINPDQISQVSPPEHIYLVPSESDPNLTYLVDMNSRLCSCPQGRLTGPCKHKEVVAKSRNLPSFDIIPTYSPLMRQTYMFIGTGQHMDLDWFLPVQAVGECEADVQYCNSQPPEQPELSNTENVEGTALETNVTVDAEDVKDTFKQTLAALTEKIMGRIDQEKL